MCETKECQEWVTELCRSQSEHILVYEGSYAPYCMWKQSLYASAHSLSYMILCIPVCLKLFAARKLCEIGHQLCRTSLKEILQFDMKLMSWGKLRECSICAYLNYDKNELSSQQLYFTQIILTWDFKLLLSWDGSAYMFETC